jgi:hypothetical protein
VLVESGEGVEDGTLADVRLPCQGQC